MYHNHTYESVKYVTVVHGVWYGVYNNPNPTLGVIVTTIGGFIYMIEHIVIP